MLQPGLQLVNSLYKVPMRLHSRDSSDYKISIVMEKQNQPRNNLLTPWICTPLCYNLYSWTNHMFILSNLDEGHLSDPPFLIWVFVHFLLLKPECLLCSLKFSDHLWLKLHYVSLANGSTLWEWFRNNFITPSKDMINFLYHFHLHNMQLHCTVNFS